MYFLYTKSRQYPSFGTISRFFGIPMDILPEVRTSSEIYGNIVDGILNGVPISGV